MPFPAFWAPNWVQAIKEYFLSTATFFFIFTTLISWKWQLVCTVTKNFPSICLFSFPGKRTYPETVMMSISWAAYNSDLNRMSKTKGSCKLGVDASGEDWRHWKYLVENHFTKENTCLPAFSMSDFPQFIITFICCVNRWSRNWFLELVLHFWSQFSKFQRLDINFSQGYSGWFSIEICVILLLTTASRLNSVKQIMIAMKWTKYENVYMDS